MPAGAPPPPFKYDHCQSGSRLIGLGCHTEYYCSATGRAHSGCPARPFRGKELVSLSCYSSGDRAGHQRYYRRCTALKHSPSAEQFSGCRSRIDMEFDYVRRGKASSRGLAGRHRCTRRAAGTISESSHCFIGENRREWRGVVRNQGYLYRGVRWKERPP